MMNNLLYIILIIIGLNINVYSLLLPKIAEFKKIETKNTVSTTVGTSKECAPPLYILDDPVSITDQACRNSFSAEIIEYIDTNNYEDFNRFMYISGFTDYFADGQTCTLAEFNYYHSYYVVKKETTCEYQCKPDYMTDEQCASSLGEKTAHWDGDSCSCQPGCSPPDGVNILNLASMPLESCLQTYVPYAESLGYEHPFCSSCEAEADPNLYGGAIICAENEIYTIDDNPLNTQLVDWGYNPLATCIPINSDDDNDTILNKCDIDFVDYPNLDCDNDGILNKDETDFCPNQPFPSIFLDYENCPSGTQHIQKGISYTLLSQACNQECYGTEPRVLTCDELMSPLISSCNINTHNFTINCVLNPNPELANTVTSSCIEKATTCAELKSTYQANCDTELNNFIFECEESIDGSALPLFTSSCNPKDPTCEDKGLVTDVDGTCKEPTCEELGMVTLLDGTCDTPSKNIKFDDDNTSILPPKKNIDIDEDFDSDLIADNVDNLASSNDYTNNKLKDAPPKSGGSGGNSLTDTMKDMGDKIEDNTDTLEDNNKKLKENTDTLEDLNSTLKENTDSIKDLTDSLSDTNIDLDGYKNSSIQVFDMQAKLILDLKI